MLNDKLCCGIAKDPLTARVGPHNHKVCLANKEYYKIQFTNKQ